MKDIKTQPVVDERSSAPKSCRTYTPPLLIALTTTTPSSKIPATGEIGSITLGAS